jgi:PAS domain S-box-containing protein
MLRFAKTTLPGYTGAIVGIVIATWVRVALDAILGDLFPFTTLFLAVMVVAALAGRGPALIAVVFGAVLSARFLLPPRDSFAVEGLANQFGMMLYVVVGVGIALLGGALREARLHAENLARESDRQSRELRSSETRLRLFVEHAPAAVAMLDRDMRYLLVSRRWLSDFDLGDIELTGRSHFEVFSSIPDRMKDASKRCLAGAVERGEEDPYLRPDGGEEWHRWECRPWRDDQGQVGGIIIFVEIVTEQVRNRKFLRENAETLAGIGSATVDNIYVVDREERYRFVSEGGARVMGFEPSEIVGKHWSELGIAPEVMRVFIDQFQEVLNTGRPAQHDAPFVSASGETREFSYTVAPIAREGERPNAVVVVSHDVTEYKVAERERLELLKKLETQYAFLNAVLSQVPAAIVVSDAQTGQILLSNDEAHRIVRHRYQAGKTLDDYGTTYLLEARRPDGTLYKSGEWPLVRAQTGQIVVGEEMELHLNDGSRVTIRVNAGPIRVGDELVAAVVAYHDISDRKATEQAVRFLADASASLAGLVDYETTLQKVASLAVPNFADWAVVDMVQEDGTIKRLAVAHADPSKADLAFEVHRRFPLDRSDARGAANVLKTGRSDFVHEITDERLVASARNEEHLRLLRELGLRSYLAVPLNLRGETQGVLGFASAESGRLFTESDLAIAEDLAARATIAIENARLYEELKRADRMKNEFLATLAHELRNPLAPIRNALHLMKGASAEQASFEPDRAMAERQVVHLTRLIDDLMDVARISRGKIELHKEILNLVTVVHQAVATSRQQIEARGHRLIVSLSEEEIRLEADPTRLEQVLWNLLNNAAKYTSPGGQIELSLVRDGQEALIRCKDSGIGIKPELLSRIFEMFHQVEEHKHHAGGGLGIGLGLAHALVEMHGGSISARSDGPGKGSEFLVRLPIIASTFAASVPTASPGAARVASVIERRVLVVDDNEDAAESLAMILTRLYGQDVRIAHDGQSALDVADRFLPELLLLDIGLPRMNGYDLAKAIRGRPWGRQAVIVALTGWGQEEDRRRAEAAGFDRHFVKPVDPAELERLLDELGRGPITAT